MGAGWVPSMLRRLDHAVSIWQRSEPRLAEFDRLPSEQAAAQLRFTPYPFEDVGAMCRESDPALYLFSSDYPHAEGGRDPLGRFDRSLADAGPSRDPGRLLRRQRPRLARPPLTRGFPYSAVFAAIRGLDPRSVPVVLLRMRACQPRTSHSPTRRRT